MKDTEYSRPEEMRTFAPGDLIPPVLGFLAAVVLGFTVEGPNTALYCLLAVACGVMLWLVMLLYRFISYLRYFFFYVHDTTTPLMDVLVSSFGGKKNVARKS